MSIPQVDEQYLTNLAVLLKQTIDPNTRKTGRHTLTFVLYFLLDKCSHSLHSCLIAEANLATAQNEQPNFVIAILRLVAAEGAEQVVRHASALYFKNYIKRNWVPEDEESNRLSDENRAWIKANIIDVLVGIPNYLQLPLIDSVTIIAENDFPHQWENLIQQLISKFNTENFAQNNAVLETIHSIFKRYRYEFRSDKLYTQINIVLDQICEPYFQLFKATDLLITQHANDGSILGVLTQTLLLLTKIFYDLNCQDLPPFFEDNINEFMDVFHNYLTYSNPLLESQDEDETGPLEKIKSSICEIVSLYTGKYEDTFTMLPKFVQTIWTLLTTTSLQQKYDILVSKAMGFLTTVVRLERYRTLFQNEETLQQFCERIILPNMSLRESDEELFSEDPIEYIRRDLEGSDSDTRRRAATDFVRGLMILYLQPITQIVNNYIGAYLQRYKENPSLWKDKDTAIYLLTSIAAQGTATKHGVTQVNMLLDVVDWFSKNVLPDFQTPVDSEPAVLKVDAIKYLYTFRNQMSKEQLVAVLPALIKHLSSTNYVVHTYAAIAIERILFTPADIDEYVQTILVSLFRLIEAGTTPETLAENDYLMKAIMRVIFTSRERISNLAPEVIEHLSRILSQISKNPSNPRFNHYVFESIGGLVRCENFKNNLALVTQFESVLFPPFDQILRQEVTEFIPYVFQILSQLLECHTEHDLPQMYRDMLPAILMPNIWSSSGNVPALVRWLQAYLYRGASSIATQNQLVPILGIFQKLLASKLNDQYALDLLTTIVEYISTVNLDQYMQAIISLLMKKLSTIKSEKFTIRFINFLCYFVALNKEGAGPDYIINAFDSIQPGLFLQVLTSIVILNLQKVQGQIERHICAVALTRLLTQSNTMLSPSYIEQWSSILTAVIKLFEAPVEIKKNGIEEEQEEYIDFELEEETEFKAAFNKLVTASRSKRDPTGIPNAREFLARSVYTLSQTHPGRISEIVNKEIPQECALYLNQYMINAGVGTLG
ncbi:8971_t:CDS:10 [Ambispora gerdemannii]|uniref:8971_t:CDS:1 n=1 Tax=Ambispora gerdemannii TaxID=144530 RepID=A0A9N8WAP7_9GLOM|nr:8971_t:CDS:10 [Ambispora gerdemannii]